MESSLCFLPINRAIAKLTPLVHGPKPVLFLHFFFSSFQFDVVYESLYFLFKCPDPCHACDQCAHRSTINYNNGVDLFAPYTTIQSYSARMWNIWLTPLELQWFFPPSSSIYVEYVVDFNPVIHGSAIQRVAFFLNKTLLS